MWPITRFMSLICLFMICMLPFTLAMLLFMLAIWPVTVRRSPLMAARLASMLPTVRLITGMTMTLSLRTCRVWRMLVMSVATDVKLPSIVSR